MEGLACHRCGQPTKRTRVLPQGFIGTTELMFQCLRLGMFVEPRYTDDTRDLWMDACHSCKVALARPVTPGPEATTYGDVTRSTEPLKVWRR